MTVPRVVLDTNVCLDLFVFRDRQCQALHAMLTNGMTKALTNEHCRREWQIVLGYRHLPLDDSGRRECAAEFDRLIECITMHKLHPHSEIRLPVCRDTDDQKFMELARDAGCQLLVTKDKALLKLARRVDKLGLFNILTPQASANWLSSHLQT